MKKSHNLTAGTNLAALVLPPDANGDQGIYRIREHDVHSLAITRIYVTEECGQMEMVPWARIEHRDGTVRLVNLAHVESVELA